MSELKIKVLNSPIFDGVAQDLVLKTDNTNRIVVANTGVVDIGSGQLYKDESGNVGIGTSTPIYKLHVSNSFAANANTDIVGLTSNYFSNAKKSLTWFTGTNPVGRISTVYNTLLGEIGVDMTFGSLYNIAAGFNDSELMRLTSGGRLGIGTPLPDAKLTVNGVASFDAGFASFPSIARSGDLDTGIFFPTTNTLAISTGGSECMRIDSSGNVGIGTSSPSAKLDVSGSVFQNGGYVNIGGFNAGTAGTSPTSGGVAFSTNISNGSAECDIWNTLDPAVFANTGLLFTQRLTSTTRRDLMFLHNNGNVGIGTNSPTAKLTVSSGESRLDLTATNANGRNWNLYSGGGGNVGAGAFAITEGGATQRFVIIGGGTSESARITNTGNFLIGTTTNKLRLTVSGTVVGDPVLGTASGTALFCNSDVAYGLMFGGTGGGQSWMQVQRTDGSATAYDLWIQPSGGNLLVGTTSASARLTVLGKNNTHGIYSEIQTATAGGYYGVYGRASIVSTYASGGVVGYSINSNTYGILGYWTGSAYWSLYGNGSTYISGTYQGSDVRLKENIEPLTGSLAKMMSLNPVEFNWKENSDQAKNGLGRDYGLIAQDVLPILPNIVKEIDARQPEEGVEKTLNEELGKFYTIEYTRLIPHLISAIQELTARLEVLENKQ